MSKIVFITEAGSQFGFGHLMRCRSLALALRKKDVECRFLINEDAHALKMLQDFPVRAYRSFEEIPGLAQGAAIAIVDSYTFSLAVYEQLSSQLELVISIDDFARIPYPAGIVINSTPLAEQLEYPANARVQYLLGSAYCFLREEFETAEERTIRETISHILVIFGGNDPHGMGEKTAVHLTKTFPHAEINLVGGFTAQGKVPGVNYFQNLSGVELKKLMAKSDLAVSAGGQTLFELARTGTPTIGVCVADNQEWNLKGMAEAGFLKHIGRHEDSDLFEKMTGALRDFETVASRLRSSVNGRRCLDGKGTARVCEIIHNRLYATDRS